MKRVEGVEDLNSRIICAQGIVGVGAIIRTCIASSPVAVCRQTAATGSPAGPTSFCLSACLRLSSAGWFLATLEKAFDAKKLTFYGSLAPLRDGRAFRRYLAPARKAEWCVYAKRPFAGPEQVLAYVARYTHRVAISNNRLLAIEEGKVRFRGKDYRNGNRQKTMSLAADEFIRRFLLHVLPQGFQRIRYYGFLTNRRREQKLTRCRQLLAMPQREATEEAAVRDYRNQYRQLTGAGLTECRACQRGHMVIIEVLKPVRPCRLVCDTS